MQMKRILVSILFLALFAGGCSRKESAWTDSSADVTFKTPEEAVKHYLEGVAQNDVRKILQASAINEMGTKFKFDLYAERLRAINPTYLAPAEYPLYAEINKAQLSSQILNQVKNLSYSLLSGEQMEGSVIQADAERANRFAKDVDPQRLSKLELKKISLPNKTLMGDPKYLENAAKIARGYGADESTERLALVSFGGNYYYVGFTLLKYGAGWKIGNQVSPLAGTSALGAAQQTTEEEFERLSDGR
jgi:PBP1b-binding outer membrane lipoprotein LpoB